MFEHLFRQEFLCIICDMCSILRSTREILGVFFFLEEQVPSFGVRDSLKSGTYSVVHLLWNTPTEHPKGVLKMLIVLGFGACRPRSW